MLPRLRFVVAALAIAILPMALLGSGIFPTPHAAATMEIPRADRPIVIGPDEYSEAQYRQDRMVFAYARRASELSRLRELASAPLAAWVAAPTGVEPENTGTTNADTTNTDAIKLIEVPSTGETPAKTPSANESRVTNPKPGEIIATLSLATIAAETATIPLAETVAEQRVLPPQEKPALDAAGMPAPVSTTPVPQLYVALNAGAGGSGEVLRIQQPPVGYFSPLPKPKPKTVKRTSRIKNAATKTTPAAQQKAPFGDLFSWLFGQNNAAQAPAIALAAASKTAAR